MSDSCVDIDIKSCRICLTNKKPLCTLFRYKLSGNYAEMLTAIADVKVSINDGLPENICSKCCTTLEKAYLLKTVAERSEKRLRTLVAKGKLVMPTKKLAFDSFTDIKNEIGSLAIKPEPKWEMEIDVNDVTAVKNYKEIKDIVIANTVIRKVDAQADDVKLNNNADTVDLTWLSTKTVKNYDDGDYFVDDAFQDDDNDADYVPPLKSKVKFKEMKVVKKMKVLKKIRGYTDMGTKGKSKAPTTPDPVLKNGNRGAPILLKRPKDSTVLKVGNYKRIPGLADVRRDKPARVVRSVLPKQREKLVCPVCGILTYTLGNHIATHEEKKKFTCNMCPRTFSQKCNLITHIKQHTGVKDHVCDDCGAGFYSQKSLDRHNLIHKGDRPFPCNLCTMRFTARCDLNRHLRIHSGYKPFKCDTCTMSFNTKHQLQTHERMHTGDRPYSCQVCNVAFSYKVNLNNHVYKTHGISLKFKSIHTVTEDVLRREVGVNETRRGSRRPCLPCPPTPRTRPCRTTPSASAVSVLKP